MPHLAREMDPERPLYAFAAPGLNSDAPFFPALEEMASAYLREVRVMQPRGPYILGGYSFGGVVAFEMARQLHLAGELVDTLILLDSFAPSARLNKLFTSWAENGTLVQVVTNLLGLEWKAKELLSAGVLPPNDPYAQTEMAARHLLAQCSIPHTFAALKAFLDRCRTVMSVHAGLLSRYRPRPLAKSVRILLLHNTLGLIGVDSALRLPVLPEEDRKPEHGWDALAPTPPVRIGVPAEHFMIGVQPAISGVARLLGQQLGRSPGALVS